MGHKINLRNYFLHKLFYTPSDYRLANEADIYNHYVAATRAKTKLLLVYINDDRNAVQFARNVIQILGKSGLKMKDVATVVDCR